MMDEARADVPRGSGHVGGVAPATEDVLFDLLPLFDIGNVHHLDLLMDFPTPAGAGAVGAGSGDSFESAWDTVLDTGDNHNGGVVRPRSSRSSRSSSRNIRPSSALSSSTTPSLTKPSATSTTHQLTPSPPPPPPLSPTNAQATAAFNAAASATASLTTIAAVRGKKPKRSWKCTKEFLLASITASERTLLLKAGITPPALGVDPASLSKAAERELRSGLRKIRNLQSAHKSRQKEKDYINILEQNVIAKDTSIQTLEGTVGLLAESNKQLAQTNTSLLSQLRELKALISNGGGGGGGDASTTASTLLMWFGVGLGVDAADYYISYCKALSTAANTAGSAAAAVVASNGSSDYGSDHGLPFEFQSRTLLLLPEEENPFPTLPPPTTTHMHGMFAYFNREEPIGSQRPETPFNGASNLIMVTGGLWYAGSFALCYIRRIPGDRVNTPCIILLATLVAEFILLPIMNDAIRIHFGLGLLVYLASFLTFIAAFFVFVFRPYFLGKGKNAKSAAALA